MNALLAWGSILAVGAAAPGSLAPTATPSTPAAATAAVPAPAPAAPVHFELRALGGPRYEMILTNDGDQALAVFGDRHLLYFEADLEPPPAASAPGKAPRPAPRPQTITCTAPADARPSEVRRRHVREIAPGGSYREPFDLRFFCWGSRHKLTGAYE